MRRWALLVAVVIAGCSQPASHPVAQATASVAVSPAVTPSVAPSASPSATPTSTPTVVPTMTDLPLSSVSFKCRLAVYTMDAGITDWLVSFPDRTAIIDVAGHNGKYFDYAVSQWVPAPREAVSPDGLHYATIDATDSDFVLQVIAFVGGKVTTIHLPFAAFSGQPSIFDYSADGIYLVNGFEHLGPGLWLVNPSTGQMRQVSKDIYPVLSAGNGIVWTQVVNPADPNPIVTGSSLGILPDEIDRVDLRSGTRTVWLYEPGKGLGVIGLDGHGSPLIVESRVWLADPNARLMLVAQPNSPTLVYSGVIVQSIGGGITDAHGTWLGGQAGVYLYASGKLLKVADRPAYASLANGCF